MHAPRAVGFGRLPARPGILAHVLLVAACSALDRPPALAQTAATGSIRGFVRDGQRAAVPEAMITITSEAAARPAVVVSNRHGLYRVVDLVPGEYTLTAVSAGFATFVRGGIAIRAGLNLHVDIDLAVSAHATAIVVEADAPMLDSSTVVRAANIAGDFQRQLPLTSRRDWAESLLLAPGVVATPSAGRMLYYLNGADFSSLVMQIDGADVASSLQSTNGYVNLSTEAIEDVQIKVGALDASTPLGAGAVINVVTASGTNRPRGSASVLYQDRGWNGSHVAAGANNAFENLQLDASVGGPVRPDAAWFFGAFRFTRNSVDVSRTPEQLAMLRVVVPGFTSPKSGLQASYPFAKLTVPITPANRLEGFWQRDVSPDNTVEANWGGAFLRRDIGGTAAGVRLASVWSGSLTTRLSMAFNNKGIVAALAREDRPSRNVHESVFISSGRLTGSGTLAVLDTLPNAPDLPADKFTFAADATWYVGSSRGSHELQGGIYLQPRLRDRTTNRYVNGGFALEEVVLRDPADAAAGFIPFRRQIYEQVEVPVRWSDGRDYALYVQDAWRMSPRLTFNAGMRVDAIRRRDAAFDVTTQRSIDVGPRVGVTYLLAADGRRAIRASWTRVADVLAQTTYAAGSSAPGYVELYDNNLDGTFDTTFATPGVSVRLTDQVLDASLHQPHTDEWIVGYQQQLRGRVTVHASVVRRAFKDRPALVEVNGVYDGHVFRGYRNEAFNEVLKVTNNSWNWPVYTLLDLYATKQARKLQVTAGYTHQWRFLAGTWQPNDPALFIQPRAFDNSRGIGSVTNTFGSTNSLSSSPVLSTLQAQAIDDTVRLAAVYRAPWGLVLATHYAFHTGLWSGPIVTRRAEPDATFGPPTVALSNGRVVSNPLATTIRFAFPTRSEGQFTLPPLHLWNVRVGREVRVGNRRLECALEVLNVTNNDAFHLLAPGANQVFSPLFRQGRQRQYPRSAQISARLVF